MSLLLRVIMVEAVIVQTQRVAALPEVMELPVLQDRVVVHAEDRIVIYIIANENEN